MCVFCNVTDTADMITKIVFVTQKTVKKESFMKKVVRVIRPVARRSLIPRSSVIKHKLDRRKKEKEKAWLKEYKKDLVDK